MLHSAKLEGKNDLDSMDIKQFIIDVALAACSIHHTILGSSAVAAVFGQDMLFYLPYLTD